MDCYKKVVAAIIAVFFSAQAFATGFQIGVGGLTPHYDVGPGWKNYCNQIGHSDVIYNPTYYGRIEGERDALTYMIGNDSICSPVQGLFYSLKLYEGEWFGYALLIGGYRFNMQNWKNEEGGTPKPKVPAYPVYTIIGGNHYIVPLAALELNFTLIPVGSWSLMLNAIVTPIISNISLSLKKTF